MTDWQPIDLEIEQALLGSVLLQNDIYAQVSDLVKPESFSERVHQEIWDICGNLIVAGKHASPLTLKPFLPLDYEIGEGVTVSAYLARLASAATTLTKARDLAVIVRDLADHRAITEVSAEMVQKRGGVDPVELAGWAIDELDNIASARTSGLVPSLTLGDSVVRAVDAAARAYQSDGALTGLSYGLADLDRKTSGLQRGELTILAGRPGQGKSLIALNFARTMATVGHRGIFFSLEMGDISLSRRMLSDMIFEQKELPHFRMKSGRFHEKDFQLIQDAAVRLGELPLRIEQQGGLTMSQISSRARQMKRRGGLDFIIVDHMGHVVPSDHYRGNKVNEVGEVSSGLLRLSRDLNCAVVALCQLNRGVESREDKRPTLADLRASGNLEEDAAVVMMVYREAYYLQNREPRAGTPEFEAWTARMEECLNVLDIGVEKNRDGSTGTVKAYVNVACNAVRDTGWARDAFTLPAEEAFAF